MLKPQGGKKADCFTTTSFLKMRLWGINQLDGQPYWFKLPLSLGCFKISNLLSKDKDSVSTCSQDRVKQGLDYPPIWNTHPPPYKKEREIIKKKKSFSGHRPSNNKELWSLKQMIVPVYCQDMCREKELKPNGFPQLERKELRAKEKGDYTLQERWSERRE